MNKILVTGCSGYIGRNLISLLKSSGFTIFGLDRKPCESLEIDNFWQGDLLDEKILKQSLEGVDSIIHLAAAKDDWGISYKEYFRDNVEATYQLIRICRERGIKNFIFYSTVGVMANSHIPHDVTAPLAPTSSYGKSKAEAEKLFHKLISEDLQVRVVIIRPTAVFGPGSPQNTNIYRLIDAIYHDRFLMIGNGRVIKTTSYIENLVAATLFLMHRLHQGLQTFIFVDDPKMHTVELVHHIYTLLQKNPPKWVLPLGMILPFAYASDLAAAVTKKDFPITAARIKKFCNPSNYDGSAIYKLGFKQPVSINDALFRTVQWYLESIKL
jgi:nucleoside-diphosphate-sugar epimerase